jgi:TPR repeat protein
MKRFVKLTFATLLLFLAVPLLNGQKETAAQKNARYQKGCDEGDAHSCDMLAIRYQFGLGVTQDDAQAIALYRQAAALYRKSCDGGGATGCTELGISYQIGSAGTRTRPGR